MTRRPRTIVALLIGSLATACVYTSPKPIDDPSIRSPTGVRGLVYVQNGLYRGELLTITTRDFTLLTAEKLVVIPFAIAGEAEFASIGVATNGAPWSVHLQQLTYASRYPYGIPTEALQAILRQHGQAAPDTARLVAR